MSLPVREVWIEIIRERLRQCCASPSLPVREVWIEISATVASEIGYSSLPVREVWIEINYCVGTISESFVTSREGSVD